MTQVQKLMRGSLITEFIVSITELASEIKTRLPLKQQALLLHVSLFSHST